jgi:hypothetical protein
VVPLLRQSLRVLHRLLRPLCILFHIHEYKIRNPVRKSKRAATKGRDFPFLKYTGIIAP